MRLVLGVLPLVASAIGASLPETQKDRVFTDKDLTAAEMKGVYLVRFTDHACMSCVVLDQQWDGLKERVKSLGLKFGEVDCSKSSGLCEMEHILDNPRLQLYLDGQKKSVLDYSASTSLDQVASFAEKGSQLGNANLGEGELKQTIEDAFKAHSALSPSVATAASASSSGSPTSSSATSAASADATESVAEDVEILSKDIFTPEHLKGVWIVKYFNPGCPHCLAFAPKYKAAYNTLGGKAGAEKMGVQLSEVNCLEQGDLCAEQGLSGVPVLITYVDGVKHDQYDGTHDEEGVLHYARDQALLAKPASPTQAKSFLDDSDSTNSSPEKSIFDPQSDGPVKLSHSNGQSVELTYETFENLVTASNEAWMIKYYSPKCAHCREMAPVWEEFAKSMAGNLNIGEVNCLAKPKYCVASGIDKYPTIRFVKGKSQITDYEGKFTIESFGKFAKLQSGSQILPIQTTEELARIVANNKRAAKSTFVYFYDEASTAEDVTAAIDFSGRLEAINGTLYRTSSEAIKKSANMINDELGLAYVDWISPPDGEPSWYKLPNGHDPTVSRDVSLVANWATTVRFASPQLLTKQVAKQMGSASRYTAILITGSDEDTQQKLALEDRLSTFREMSLKSWDEAVAQHTRDQAKMRQERQDLYVAAKAEKEFQKARMIYDTNVKAPSRTQLSYGYIPVDKLDLELPGFFAAGSKSPGDVIVYSFYDGRYIDELDGSKMVNINAIPTAVSELDSRNPTNVKRSKKIKGIPAPLIAEPAFKVPSSRTGKAVYSFAVVVALFIVLTICMKSYRDYMASRQRGPILNGKMD